MDIDSVIAARDVDSIYEVPVALSEEGIDDLISSKLSLETKKPDLSTCLTLSGN